MVDSQKLLYDLFEAYYDTRRNKRSSCNAIKFEINYESKLLNLHKELVDGTYIPGKSIYFIYKGKVKREVFAADFRDRVVHHLVYNYVYKLFDNHFINDSYACRVGKGTHYGIKRLDHFVRSCSNNYQKDSFVLKMDIKGYFMSIDKDILRQIVYEFLVKKENNLDIDMIFLLDLIKKIIYHNPTENCVFKGNKSDYQGLPQSKSLFFSGLGKGLPIGNLTSQLFANMYLDSLDKYIKYELGCKYYGRYVDDFFVVHEDKEYLISIISKIKNFLDTKLQLTLHPQKIYLQHISRGVLFLGAFIKPWRIYVNRTTLGIFYQKLEQYHIFFKEHTTREYNKLEIITEKEVKKKTIASINSYGGIIKHYSSYKVRKKLFEKFPIPFLDIKENYSGVNFKR